MLEQIVAGSKSLQPEIALSVTFCVMLIADLIAGKRQAVLPWIALAGLLVTAYCLAWQGSGGTSSVLFNMFAVDAFSLFFPAMGAGLGATTFFVADQLNNRVLRIPLP